jgi:hypothetical protein
MNLILRPLNDVNDPTWSVIISLGIILLGVLYIIINIMKEAFEELDDGSHDTTKQEELLQLPSDRNQQSS